MTERRSLANAMQLTPDKMVFIRGQQTALSADVPTDTVPPPQRPDSTPRHAITKEPRRPKRPQVRSQPRERKEDEAALTMIDVLLVPLTTRLQPKTANALRRAYLEQKLRRRLPATQQEIVETALSEWLRHHGYMQ
jgi:hypothetical protein